MSCPATFSQSISVVPAKWTHLKLCGSESQAGCAVTKYTQRAKAGRSKVWVEIGPDNQYSLMAAGVLGEWDLDDRKALLTPLKERS